MSGPKRLTTRDRERAKVEQRIRALAKQLHMEARRLLAVVLEDTDLAVLERRLDRGESVLAAGIDFPSTKFVERVQIIAGIPDDAWGTGELLARIVPRGGDAGR